VCDSGTSIAQQLPALGTSLIRTHDARVLDLPSLFPDPAGDPDNPAAYNFSAGDALFAAILAAGHRAYFRLGVSWPPGPPPVPAWALCPAPELMARVSLRTVQHYNDAAWAGGFAGRTVAAWEIWNEPDGLDPLMWCGSAAQFYALYNATATALKAYDPSLRVGGPAVARVGSSAAYGTGFVDYIAASGAPLDFFSWHSYGSAAQRAASAVQAPIAAVRAYLNGVGLAHVEQHVSEWNTDAAPSQTQRDTPLAAAYVAQALSFMAAGNVSVALFYPGCEGYGASSWGLFQDPGGGGGGTGVGVGMRPETYAYAAAGQTLRNTPWPAAVPVAPADATVLAGAAAAPALRLAANVSVLVSTQGASFNSLSLALRGLAPALGLRVIVEVIDAGSGAGAPANSQHAAVTGADGTLTVTTPLAPPAVVRVQLLLE